MISSASVFDGRVTGVVNLIRDLLSELSGSFATLAERKKAEIRFDVEEGTYIGRG